MRRQRRASGGGGKTGGRRDPTQPWRRELRARRGLDRVWVLDGGGEGVVRLRRGSRPGLHERGRLLPGLLGERRPPRRPATGQRLAAAPQRGGLSLLRCDARGGPRW